MCCTPLYGLLIQTDVRVQVIDRQSVPIERRTRGNDPASRHFTVGGINLIQQTLSTVVLVFTQRIYFICIHITTQCQLNRLHSQAEIKQI